jgi:hypothetical protein
VVSAELGVETTQGGGDLTVWNYRVWQGTATGGGGGGVTGTKFQAEDPQFSQFSGTGMSVHTDLPGYEGTGFLAWFSDPGDQMTMTLPIAAVGTYDVNIRYRSLGTQQNNVIINGGAPRSETFASGDAFATKTLTNVPLQAGSNTIAITKDWGWIGVDYVEIVPAGVARIQAENAQFSGPGNSVHTDVPGYDGTGFVAWFSEAADQLSLSFPNVAAGNYDINIRYRSLGSQQNNVVINGGAALSKTFASGDAFATMTLSAVALQAGTNTIAFTKDWGWIGIDYVEIVPR